MKKELIEILMKRAKGFFVEEEEVHEEIKTHMETGKTKYFPTKRVVKKKFIQSETALLSLLAYIDPEKFNEKILIEKEKLAMTTASKMKEYFESLPDEKLEALIKKIEDEARD